MADFVIWYDCTINSSLIRSTDKHIITGAPTQHCHAMEPERPVSTIRVVSHRVATKGDSSYAVYTIRTSDDSGSGFEVERRWSELRELYNSLKEKWRPQLSRSSLKEPSFRHHTYRLGSRRVDPALLREREQQMERLLHYFARALQLRICDSDGPEELRLFLTEDARPSVDFNVSGRPIRSIKGPGRPGGGGLFAAARGSLRGRADNPALCKVDPPYRGRVELTPAEWQMACDAPTPEYSYYTPSAGWPPHLGLQARKGREHCCQTILLGSNRAVPGGGSGALHERQAPPPLSRASTSFSLLGTAADEPVVGELRIEVLECAGLPNLDTFSLTDAFALVLLEGTAARTCTIDDHLDPKVAVLICLRTLALPFALTPTPTLTLTPSGMLNAHAPSSCRSAARPRASLWRSLTTMAPVLWVP